MRPCVASTLAAGLVLCQVALVGFVFNAPARDADPRRGLLGDNQTLTAAQIQWLLSTVEELTGTTEAKSSDAPKESERRLTLESVLSVPGGVSRVALSTCRRRGGLRAPETGAHNCWSANGV